MPRADLSAREVMLPDPVTVPPDCPIADVMHEMNARRIGAVLVAAGGRLAGIFTERDLLRRVSTALPGWRDFPVSHWMTADPYTVGPDVGWEAAVGLMQRLRVRHLPVVEGGRILGVISSRALMARRTEYLDAAIADQTRDLRRANDQLLARDAEMTYNLRAAGRLQQKLLLPAAPPAWPELDWAVYFAPLDHLGGDYYDFATPGPDRLGFLIADASGHSIPAAIVAVMARVAFAEVANRLTDPGAVLTAVNARLIGLTDERFVTAFYGVLERGTRVFRYAAAGHPDPYLVRPATAEVRTLAARGFLLGVMPGEVYPTREVSLEPGDRLFFLTDGLIEGYNEIGEQFGNQRLMECLQEYGRLPAAELLAAVRKRHLEFCGDKPAADDVTAAVLAVL